MSEINKLAGSPIAGLPGSFPLLPKASFETLGTAEEFLEKNHLRKSATAGIGLPSDLADRLIAVACSDVVLSRLRFGKPAFWHSVHADSLKPFFLFILMSQNDPKFTQDKAAALLTPLTRAERDTVGYALAEAFGYDVNDVLRPKAPEKNAPAGETADQSQNLTESTIGLESGKP